jgi:hypothetical protein
MLHRVVNARRARAGIWREQLELNPAEIAWIVLTTTSLWSIRP